MGTLSLGSTNPPLLCAVTAVTETGTPRVPRRPSFLEACYLLLLRSSICAGESRLTLSLPCWRSERWPRLATEATGVTIMWQPSLWSLRVRSRGANGGSGGRGKLLAGRSARDSQLHGSAEARVSRLQQRSVLCESPAAQSQDDRRSCTLRAHWSSSLFSVRNRNLGGISARFEPTCFVIRHDAGLHHGRVAVEGRDFNVHRLRP